VFALVNPATAIVFKGETVGTCGPLKASEWGGENIVELVTDLPI
jgi:hypothetical protein